MRAVRVRTWRTGGLARRIVPDGARHRLNAWMLGGRRRARCYALLRSRVRQNMVRRDTRIVFEGYPRSANTYVTTAFRLTNEGARYASHLHSPVNVELGVRRAIPVVVLIRDPLDAVTSELQYETGLSPALALAAYLAFYRRVVPLLDDVLLVSFESATEDFGSVVRAVNARFGTGFRPYRRTPEQEAEVWAMIDWEDRLFRGDRPGLPRTVARPAPERDAEKPALHRLLLGSTELDAARRLYGQLRARAL